jgi:DegV family protein with EDD domain
VDRQEKRRIAIVTDSTCDLPPDFIAEYGIHVIPQILLMGERQWRDGVDIDPPSFYELLRTSPDFPASSQPSAVDFVEAFSQVKDTSDGVVAILVSNELSGTVNSALTATASLADFPIEIVDSRSVSLPLGFQVMAAARAADSGGDLETVAAAARDLIDKTGVYFVVDTLEYLHRGGRIGGAARLVGSALNLKPVLEIKDGAVSPLTRVRTRRKALNTVLEIMAERLAGAQRVHLGVLHIAAAKDAARFGDQLQEAFNPVQVIHAECGPVIGCHAGPGTIGVAYWVEE